MTDHNCFIGAWPFYRLEGTDLAALRKAHAAHGITGGYLSALPSVFYNDFYESERCLAEQIRGSDYFHTVLPNPTVTGAKEALAACFAEFAPRGIRLVPGYQGYSLRDECLSPVLEAARARRIPLFVNARLSDERMTHLIHPTVPTPQELWEFSKRAEGITLVLCHLTEQETAEVLERAGDAHGLFFDTTGNTGSLLAHPHPAALGRTVLGTGFPLYSVTSAVLRLEKELPDGEEKRRILS